MNIFVSTWALLVGGLVTTLPMIYLRVKDHTEDHEEISNILYVSAWYDIWPTADNASSADMDPTHPASRIPVEKPLSQTSA